MVFIFSLSITLLPSTRFSAVRVTFFNLQSLDIKAISEIALSFFHAVNSLEIVPISLTSLYRSCVYWVSISTILPPILAVASVTTTLIVLVILNLGK